MIRKCLFPVAGYGTRFLPATKAMPKEMLPIVNKPLVQYGVEEAAAAGLNRIGFITGRGKRSIADQIAGICPSSSSFIRRSKFFYGLSMNRK